MRGGVVDIDAPEVDLYRIAIPDLRGLSREGALSAEVVRNDLRLVSLFRLLEPSSFVADLEREGTGIHPSSWSSIGAQGVIKGEVTGTGGRVHVEIHLYEVAHGAEATLSETYDGPPRQLRRFMHDFANRVLWKLTGSRGHFNSRLTFARRIGPGRKDVYVASMDGHHVGRVSSPQGVSMLPSFGPGGIWFSRLTELGMFITHSNAEDRPIIEGDGLNMGAVPCNGRIYFTSTRDGNSEIYSATTEGRDVRRITRNPAIDVSPACGPGGKIAFVSARHGTPQIFVMNGDGSGVRRVTYRGEHNQTPAWCMNGRDPLLAFTGRSGGFDVFTVNVATQEYTRLTQGQGRNKDPAFSPDCRIVAFSSTRGGGGVYLSNPQGLNQTRIIAGAAETIRWSN